ncbi:IS4 family transposase [Armatimonas sp.]|uniref:IS4 family transposase n=1 Tax=Armatimonas sp. TaxID=1872638 RepID=UPI00286BEC6D|nr:IS4 family transposase [Armatimonas sp.]
MSDNLKRYCAIKKALISLRPTEPKGNQARHINTLAMIVAGVIGSQKCHLPAIAKKVPSDAKPQNRVRKMERFMDNDAIDCKKYYLPYADTLIRNLPPGPLVLIMDGSEVGRDCVMLSLNVVYKKRALPLCWIVVKGKKGHLPQDTHIELLEQAAKIIPQQRRVIFLGDGEFDGTKLLETLQSQGWDYVCRTAKNVVLTEDAQRFSPQDLILERGERLELPDVGFTAKEYGPVLVSIVWEPSWDEPLILVSNLDFLEEAYHFYQRRFRIETFFSDQKSRGFYLGHSHISNTSHLHRLLIGLCLAYLWIVCMGAWVVQTGRVALIHRTDRCDWSLFHLGLNWIEHCLNEGLPLRTRFPRSERRRKCVG